MLLVVQARISGRKRIKGPNSNKLAYDPLGYKNVS